MNGSKRCGVISAEHTIRLECDMPAGHAYEHMCGVTPFVAGVPNSTLAERRERTARRKHNLRRRQVEAAELSALTQMIVADKDADFMSLEEFNTLLDAVQTLSERVMKRSKRSAPKPPETVVNDIGTKQIRLNCGGLDVRHEVVTQGESRREQFALRTETREQRADVPMTREQATELRDGLTKLLERRP